MHCIYAIYKSGKRTFVCLSHSTVMLVRTYKIYVRDNVVQNSGHYRKNKPRQGEPDPEVSCFALKGIIFDNDPRRYIHYPAYYTAPCQTKQYLHTVCLFTITIHSVDQQRNSLPKTLTSPCNRTCWG